MTKEAKKITPAKTESPAKDFFFWQGMLFTSEKEFKKHIEQINQ